MIDTAPHETLAKTLELLIHREDLDPEQWLDFPDYGLRQYFLWKNPETGASIALVEFEKGGRIPVQAHPRVQPVHVLPGRRLRVHRCRFAPETRHFLHEPQGPSPRPDTWLTNAVS